MSAAAAAQGEPQGEPALRLPEAAGDARIVGADFLRAFACLSVVAHHLAQRVDIAEAPAWLRPVLRLALEGSAGVSVFFVLSGFLLARFFWLALAQGAPMPSLGVYALRRLARIAPGFWLALAVSLVVSVTLFAFPLDAELGLRFLAGFLFVSDWHWRTFFPMEVDGALWSIGFEVSSYALLPLGFLLLFALNGRARGANARAALLLGAWAAVLALALLAHWAFTVLIVPPPENRGFEYGFQGGARLWMPAWNPFGFFATFAVGAAAAGALALLAPDGAAGGRVRAAVALYAMVLVPWLPVDAASGGFGIEAIPYSFPHLALSAALLLILLPAARPLQGLVEHRAVRALAALSFGIYLWHQLVIDTVRHLAAPFVVTTRLWPWLFLCTPAVLLTLLIAKLSFEHLERPAIRAARRLERRLRVQAHA